MDNKLFIGNLILPTRRALVVGGAVLGATAAVSGANPVLAIADTAEEKKAEAALALAKLDALEAQLDAASAEYGAAIMEQEAAQAKMAEAQTRIDQKNDEITVLQKRLGNRAKSMYRTGSFSVLDLLMGATSFKAFTTNWGILNDMSEEDARMVEETKLLRAQIEEEKAEYARQEAEAADRAVRAARTQADAQMLCHEMEEAYNSLSREAADLLAQEEAAREAQRQAEAAARIANERNMSATSAGTGPLGSVGAGSQQTPAETTSPSTSASPSSPSSSSAASNSNPMSTVHPLPNTKINNDKPQSVDADIVLSRARGELGKPYVWGACGPKSFDCSGLVSYCLGGEYGKRLGTTYTFYYWTRVTDPQPGDICVSWGHCGVYIGNGQMIHAPNPRKCVMIGAVWPEMIFVRY